MDRGSQTDCSTADTLESSSKQVQDTVAAGSHAGLGSPPQTGPLPEAVPGGSPQEAGPDQAAKCLCWLEETGQGAASRQTLGECITEAGMVDLEGEGAGETG